MTRRQARIALGVCLSCGEDPDGTSPRCVRCKALCAAAAARYRAAGKITKAQRSTENAVALQRKRDRGECYSCRRAATAGYRRCLPCRSILAVRYRVGKWRRIAP